MMTISSPSALSGFSSAARSAASHASAPSPSVASSAVTSPVGAELPPARHDSGAARRVRGVDRSGRCLRGDCARRRVSGCRVRCGLSCPRSNCRRRPRRRRRTTPQRLRAWKIESISVGGSTFPLVRCSRPEARASPVDRDDSTMRCKCPVRLRLAERSGPIDHDTHLSER